MQSRLSEGQNVTDNLASTKSSAALSGSSPLVREKNERFSRDVLKNKITACNGFGNAIFKTAETLRCGGPGAGAAGAPSHPIFPPSMHPFDALTINLYYCS